MPRLGIFAVSFAIVGYYWVLHHLTFAMIDRATRGLMWWNLGFLLTIVVLPYPTAVLGRYPLASPALILYGSNVFACSLLLWATWIYALRAGLLRPVPRAQVRLSTIRFTTSSAISLAGTLLAFFVTPLALAVFVMLPTIYALTSRPPANDERAA